MGTIWLYWETRKRDSIVPPYIALCRKSAEVHAKDYDVRLVTRANVGDYLSDISRWVFEIEAQPAGVLICTSIAITVGGVRLPSAPISFEAFLLEKYGGLYIVSEALLLADPVPSFRYLRRPSFCRQAQLPWKIPYIGFLLGGQARRNHHFRICEPPQGETGARPSL